MSDKRATGYYWIKYDVNTDWETAAYSSELDSWMLTGSELHSVDGEFYEIDETPIVRKPEPTHFFIQKDGVYNLPDGTKGFLNVGDRVPFNPNKNGVQDLTKPMAHDMNPLQRNFIDSTH